MCQGALKHLERRIGIVLVEVIDAAEHGCRGALRRRRSSVDKLKQVSGFSLVVPEMNGGSGAPTPVVGLTCIVE